MGLIKYIMATLTVILSLMAFAKNTPVISASELLVKKKNNQNIIILDVRSESEYKSGHVPDAINIPHNKIQEHLTRLDKSKEIIVYCHSGYRAGIAEEELAKLGFKVFHLKDDMVGWKSSKHPLQK